MRRTPALFLVFLSLAADAAGQVSVDLRALDAVPAQPGRPAQAAPRQAAPLQAAPLQAAPTQAAPTQAAPTQAAPFQARPPSPATSPPSPAQERRARPAAAKPPVEKPVAENPSIEKPLPAKPLPAKPLAAQTPAREIPMAAPTRVPALPSAVPPMPPPPSTMALPPAPTASPAPAAIQVLFNQGETALSPDGTSAVQTMARSMRQPNAGSITVLAYATSKADDLSTARRLSLARGMAIRSVLMENGIASDQIYVRALGRPASGGPEDRVDLTAGRIGELGRPDHEVGKR